MLVPVVPVPAPSPKSSVSHQTSDAGQGPARTSAQGIRRGLAHCSPVLPAEPAGDRCGGWGQVGRTGSSVCLLGVGSHAVGTQGLQEGSRSSLCTRPPGTEGQEDAVSEEKAGKAEAGTAPPAACCSVLWGRD